LGAWAVAALPTWSMAQGMRQFTSARSKMWGKDEAKEGAAWMAGKECLPMLSESEKPKMPLAWEYVTAFSMRQIFGYMWLERQ
jgi:hypothetical protein